MTITRNATIPKLLELAKKSSIQQADRAMDLLMVSEVYPDQLDDLIKHGNYDSVALRAIDKLASLEIERDGGRPISEYFISSLLTLSKESQYKKHVVKHLMHLFVSLQKTTIEDLFKCVDYKLPGDVMDILHLEILSRAQYSWHYCAVASTTGNSKIAEDAFSKFLDNIIHLTSRIANSSCAGTQKKAKAILDLLGQKV